MKDLKLTQDEIEILLSVLSVKKGELSRLLKKHMSDSQLKLKDELEPLIKKVWDLKIK